MKMGDVLIQQGLLKALKKNQWLSEMMSADKKEEKMEKAHSALLLCLANNVLLKVLRMKVSENRGKEQGNGLMARCRSTDHAGSKNKGRSRSQSKARKLKCYHCHKEVHYKKDCPKHKGNKNDNSKTDDIGVVVEDNYDGANVLSVTISSSNGRHVPELRKNLISLGTLDSNGCSHWAADGVVRIMKGALITMKGLKQNSLYLLQGSIVTEAAVAAASSSDIDSDTIKLWHMCLGHLSERGMDVLSKQGFLGNKKIGKPDFYEHCIFGSSVGFIISRDVTFDESSMLLKEEELIDVGKDHGVREKV
ncbi:hypothetical protein RJ639_047590 [Escallonia herrerae]|uniref:CCHC-type domain-containing protein n=1 Tax=Escallonia herrerae TaxID=1293975 RepID=A0AA89B151_9ASTE|nr:hypothetical protein RJ639_047590 [Escallonia herrerae]